MKENKITPHIFSLSAIALFSTIEVTGKLIGANISPYAITAWRFLIGGLVILPFALREISSRKQSFGRKALIQCALAGIMNVCISMLFLQLSIFHGKAALSAVIVSTNTLFVALFAFLFLKESIARLHIIGLGIGLLGLFFIIYGEKTALLQSHSLVLGVLFGVGAALTFALYTVYSTRIIAENGSLPTLSFSFLLGAIGLFIYSALAGKALLFTPSVSNLSFLLYLSLFVTGLAYIMYFGAIRQIGAARASLYFFLKPALACVLAWLLCHETLNSMQILGVLLIMLSLSREVLAGLFRVCFLRSKAA